MSQLPLDPWEPVTGPAHPRLVDRSGEPTVGVEPGVPVVDLYELRAVSTLQGCRSVGELMRIEFPAVARRRTVHLPPIPERARFQVQNFRLTSRAVRAIEHLARWQNRPESSVVDELLAKYLARPAVANEMASSVVAAEPKRISRSKRMSKGVQMAEGRIYAMERLAEVRGLTLAGVITSVLEQTLTDVAFERTPRRDKVASEALQLYLYARDAEPVIAQVGRGRVYEYVAAVIQDVIERNPEAGQRLMLESIRQQTGSVHGGRSSVVKAARAARADIPPDPVNPLVRELKSARALLEISRSQEMRDARAGEVHDLEASVIAAKSAWDSRTPTQVEVGYVAGLRASALDMLAQELGFPSQSLAKSTMSLEP